MSETEIAVIVPCVNALSDFEHAVTALLDQDGPVPEIIAVSRLGPGFSAAVRSRWPGVTLLDVPAGTTIPDMRAVGFRAASAPAIGMIEDHVVVPQDWTTRMLAAIAEGADVVAGPVDNLATGTLVDRAAFLCEYSSVLPPLPSGPTDWLPGNNTVYRKIWIDRMDGHLDAGQWENVLHAAMLAEGARLEMRNEIIAGHKMHYSFGLYLQQRYLYSKSFAGGRVEGQGSARRLAMGAAAFALPAVVFVRILRNVLSKGRYQRELLQSVPLLIPFCLSWGLGEVAGYWFGAGKSLSRVV